MNLPVLIISEEVQKMVEVSARLDGDSHKFHARCRLYDFVHQDKMHRKGNTQHVDIKGPV